MQTNSIADERDFVAAAAACKKRDLAAHQLCYFLPKEKAAGVRAMVAGCAMIRDVIDAPAGAGDCSGGMAEGGGGVAELVHTQMERVYADELELPESEFRDGSQHILAALAQTLKRFEAPRELMMTFVDACRDDAATARYATWNSLRRQCERLGGSVAGLIACVLGATSSEVGRFAADFGAAARLTSIVSTLKADVSRGRIYLPMEDMARCRYPERELIAGVDDGRLGQLTAIQIERAQELLASASEGVCWVAGDGSRMAAAMMLQVIRVQLDRLSRRESHFAAAGLRPASMGLLRLLPAAMRLARRQADQPLPRTR